MEFKKNEATPNRPKGDRVLDAPEVTIDLQETVVQLTQEKAWVENDRNGITVFKAPVMTVVMTILKPEARIEENDIKGLLTVQVFYGRIEIALEDRQEVLHKGQMIAIHARVRHSIRALEETALLLTTLPE